MLWHDIVPIETRVISEVYAVCSPPSDRIWILDKATDVNQEGCFITGESLDAVLKGLTFFAFEVLRRVEDAACHCQFPLAVISNQYFLFLVEG
jgi:hypothetical protein